MIEPTNSFELNQPSFDIYKNNTKCYKFKTYNFSDGFLIIISMDVIFLQWKNHHEYQNL